MISLLLKALLFLFFLPVLILFIVFLLTFLFGFSRIKIVKQQFKQDSSNQETNQKQSTTSTANISDAIQIAMFLGGNETGSFTREDLESLLDMHSSELAKFLRTGENEGWLAKNETEFLITPKGREHGRQLCRDLRV